MTHVIFSPSFLDGLTSLTMSFLSPCLVLFYSSSSWLRTERMLSKRQVKSSNPERNPQSGHCVEIARIKSWLSHRAAPAEDATLQNRRDPDIRSFRLIVTRIVSQRLRWTHMQSTVQVMDPSNFLIKKTHFVRSSLVRPIRPATSIYFEPRLSYDCEAHTTLSSSAFLILILSTIDPAAHRPPSCPSPSTQLNMQQEWLSPATTPKYRLHKNS